MNDTRTDELTEEEFLELVLEEQEKALAEERARRLAGQKPKPKTKPTTKLIVWLMALTLTFSTFSVILSIYSIPAIEFLKVSASLSQQEDIQHYKKSVVTISTNDGKGTGFIIREDGYIVTNEHVIDGAVTITAVFPDDTLYKAEVVAKNADIDLALLKVEAENLPTLTLAKSSEYVAQKAVYFIGNPLAFSGIANKGTVIGETAADGITTEILMMDAPVYKGNSGSPVLNKDGEVIGIVFATGKRAPFGKVGLVIPIEAYEEFLAPALK
ncbi:MAG: serine protease [Solibacillus sp.]